MPALIQKKKIKVDVNELVHSSLELTKFRIKKKKIELQLNLNEEPIYVYGEPHYLGQVLVNLIMNAYDAITDEGKLIISTNGNATNVEITF
ncbi:MAG: hypothetical protein U5K00_08120 [Melioribacteraceae bacterium]|nr:hypothetical protein [Melioribacteraceae bacterium]